MLVTPLLQLLNALRMREGPKLVTGGSRCYAGPHVVLLEPLKGGKLVSLGLSP